MLSVFQRRTFPNSRFEGVIYMEVCYNNSSILEKYGYYTKIANRRFSLWNKKLK